MRRAWVRPARSDKHALLLASLLAFTQGAHPQEPAPAQQAEPQKVPRSTGLPEGGEWTFNFDAAFGAFGFNNSLYVPAPFKADPSGELSDDWLESYIKASVAADFPRKHGAFFGKVSAVGERTFSAPPSLVGEEASSFHAEDAYIGWRSGAKAGDDGFELLGGRAPYKIGHSFLLADGAGDGGSRGGFWSGARKAWNLAGIASFRTKRNLLEAFYLDRDELPENDTDTELWGANYELTLGKGTTAGLSYFETMSEQLPQRDGMSVYNGRLFSAPFDAGALSGLSLDFEYAQEQNTDAQEAIGWAAGAGFKFNSLPWKPQLAYRYAFFEGDDPATPESEAFDPLFPGFHDWGSWYQGEIAGEYFLSNSNLISHQVRLGFEPKEELTWGLIGYAFYLDQPEAFAPGVTAEELAFEVDGHLDWKINDNFTTSLVLAYAEPQEGVEQGLGRTEAMSYGMFYLSYAY